jgi:hypothetical protein
MRFGKNANFAGRWQFVDLNDEEVEQAHKELIENNMRELQRCVDTAVMDAKGSEHIIEKSDIMIVALALAEKQMTASFSFINNVLDRKIAAMKDRKSVFTPASNKQPEKAPEKTGTKEGSILDEVFNTHDEENGM